MLTGQTADDYERYRKKVKFFGATGRALDGLHGSVFRKTCGQSSSVSGAFDKSLEDVDLTGANIEHRFSEKIDNNVVIKIVGIKNNGEPINPEK